MAFRGSRFLFKYISAILIFLAIPAFLVYFSFQYEDITMDNKNTTLDQHATRSPNSSILVLYWTNVFDERPNVTEKRFEWPFLFAPGNNCPVKCEVSSNKSRLSEAAALVMHGRNINELPLSSNVARSLPWIYHVNENPVYATSLKNEAVMGKFSYLATYRLDSDFPCPEFTRPDLTKPVPFADKTGLAVAIYSHCEDIRTLYMLRLTKHLTIDSYGKCLRNRPRIPGGKNETKALMRRYKFTLIFPNADCDYYMTEKIYNALSAGSVPVWMGTDKIDEVLQWGNLRRSVIKVRDFASPKKLADYLLYLSRHGSEYNRYLKWKYEGFQFPAEYHRSPIGQWWDGLPLYCRVCMRIAKDRFGHCGFPVDRCGGKQRRTLEKWIRE